MARPLVFSADHLTFSSLVTAASQVRVVAPGLDKRRAHAVSEAARRGADVRVVLDPSEETERHGLGDLRTVDLLREAGAEVRQLPGVAVGLIVADGAGYLHFARSRMFAADGEGLDAIRLDALMAARVVRAFFPPRDEAEARTEAARLDVALDVPALVEEITETPEPVRGLAPIDEEGLAAAQESLERNPPRDPDLTRQLSVYTNRLQFVEITIRGGTLSSQTVSLPKDLPLGVSRELRKQLDAKLRVFERGAEELKRYRSFLRDAEALRDEFAILIRSRDKRVIRTEHLPALKDALRELKAEIPDIQREVAAHVVSALNHTRSEIEREVIQLLADDPPDGLSLFQADPGVYETLLTDRARRIVADISFPDPVALLARLNIEVHYYDPTWEDFDDEDFIRELYDAGAIDRESADELRHLRSAFEAKSP